MAKKSTFRAPHDIQHKGRTYKKGDLMPSKYRRAFTTPNDKDNPRKTDSAAGIDAAAPNFGRFAMPHIQTFQGLITSAAHTYRNPDEAIKHCRENALKMRRDCFVMECIEARQRGVAMLGWHIEPEDNRDPAQKEIAELITGIMSQIPRFTEMRRSLLEAVWAGRHAVQTQYGEIKRMGKKYWGVVGWKPIHGDKLAFRYDDGTGEFDENQIGIRVTAANMKEDVMQGPRKLEATEWGMAYFLESWERDLIVVHKHMIEDAAFEDYISSGSIHGVGIRSRIYWTWLQMAECMAFLLEYIERTGQGIWIYYYPSGNEVAKQEVEETAERSTRSNVILMPRMSGDAASDPFGIERIDPSPQGAENLKTVIHEFFGHRIKRYVLGQTLSTESDAAGMGSGLADLHYNSYLEIVKYDATNLEETITQEIVRQIKEKNFPEWSDYHFKFKIDTESAEKEKKLASFRQAYDMGARIRESDVMDAIGVGAPQDGDVVLQNPTIRQQERLWQQQMQQDGMGGAGGGGMPGDGGDPNNPNGGGPGGGPATGPNGEDLHDLFGPLVSVAQGGGAQFANEGMPAANSQAAPVKYAKTGEVKPATTTPDTGTPTTKEQGNSNPNPAPAGAAPAGASAPPGSNAPTAGGGATAAAPPSLPKPPKMPGANDKGAGAGSGPAGTNDAPGGTAEIGKDAKPANQAQAGNTAQNPAGTQGAPPSNSKSGDGTAPTPDRNPAAAPAQGQQPTQGQQSPQNQSQPNNAAAQPPGAQPPGAQPPGGQQSIAAEPPVWQSPEFKQQQPQRQKFVAQHFQQAVKSNAMPKSVGGMFRAMMASPNFQSNAEYVTHDFAPEQAQAVHQELAAQAGREYGGGYVCDLSATHGAGAIGFTSPAGAMVLTPPAQPGGKWITNYSANTGVVQRAMSGESPLPMAMSADSGGAAAGQQPTAPYAMADTSKPPRMASKEVMASRNGDPSGGKPGLGERAFDTITDAGIAAQSGLKTAAKAVPAAVQGATTAASTIAKLAGATISGVVNGGSKGLPKPKTGGRNLDQEIGELMEGGKEESPAEQPEPVDSKSLRAKHETMLQEWVKKDKAGGLTKEQNQEYRSKLSALKSQISNAKSAEKDKAEEDKAAAPAPAKPAKPKSALEKQREIKQAAKESADNFRRTGKTLEGKEFHTLTRDEFVSETGLPATEHKAWIKDAIERGDDIPAEVLAKYPEIEKSAKSKQESAALKKEREAAMTESAKARAERIKNAPPPKAKTIKNDPNAVNNEDRQYLISRDKITNEQIDAMEPAEAKAKAQQYREEFLAKQKTDSEAKLAADKERAELAKTNDEGQLKLRRYEAIDAMTPDAKKNFDSIVGKDHGGEQIKAAGFQPSEKIKNMISESVADGTIRNSDDLTEILAEAKKSYDKNRGNLDSNMTDPGKNIARAISKHQESVSYQSPAAIIKQAAEKNGVSVEDLNSAIDEVHGEKDKSHKEREQEKAAIRKRLKLDAGDLHRLHDAGKDYTKIEGFDTIAAEIQNNKADYPYANSAMNSAQDPLDALVELIKEGVDSGTPRHDEDVIKDALKFLKSRKSDFWDDDIPPQAFKPAAAAREPGDEDEELTEPEENKKNRNATDAVPFRKSLDSAARIKLLRQQRPDLFAI